MGVVQAICEEHIGLPCSVLLLSLAQVQKKLTKKVAKPRVFKHGACPRCGRALKVVPDFRPFFGCRGYKGWADPSSCRYRRVLSREEVNELKPVLFSRR